MTFKELATQRQSNRKYDQNKPLPREVIERILEVARLAPSATNSQPWHFILVDDPETLSEVAKTLTSPLTGSMNKFAATAPALLVLVEEPANISGKAGSILLNKHLPAYDIGIISSYIALAAQEEGVGSCIMGWVDEKKLRKILGVPRGKKLPLVIALGYSIEEQRTKKRKPLSELLSYNKYKK